MAIYQLVLLDAKCRQHRRVKLIRMGRPLDGGVTDGVGGADNLPAAYAASEVDFALRRSERQGLSACRSCQRGKREQMAKKSVSNIGYGCTSIFTSAVNGSPLCINVARTVSGMFNSPDLFSAQRIVNSPASRSWAMIVGDAVKP